MYLKQAFIENSGALKQVDFVFPFSPDGLPKPIVLVGANGSGKTNFLSLIADALFEAAVPAFQDVVQGGGNLSRPWFRVVGSANVRLGAQGDCAILHFEDGGKNYFYTQKSGSVDPEQIKARVPDVIANAIKWSNNTQSIKTFDISDDDSRRIFREEAYAYFPSSRAEIPSWLNASSVKLGDFDLSKRFTNILGKPLFVERGLEFFKQWLLALIVDIRTDFHPFYKDDGGVEFRINEGAAARAFRQRGFWEHAVRILQLIVGKDVHFVWGGRHGQNKIMIARSGSVFIPSLDALSSGQSTLLNIFGTLLRYGDRPGLLRPADISGICLVDEIDAHMHVELQCHAIPELMKLFPKVQFIVSTHSPLTVMGLEKIWGAENFSLLEMPDANLITPESYSEFARAFDAMRTTVAFRSAVEVAVSEATKALVFLEGETDPIYLESAARLLGREDLLDKVEFAWIGAKNPENGQGFHTGKDALNTTLKFLRAKPELIKQTIILMYDADAKKADADYGHLHVRSVPTNGLNKKVKIGIENLLPEHIFENKFFDNRLVERDDGGSVTTVTLNKMRLCDFVCGEQKNKEDFVNFLGVINLVDQLVGS